MGDLMLTSLALGIERLEPKLYDGRSACRNRSTFEIQTRLRFFDSCLTAEYLSFTLNRVPRQALGQDLGGTGEVPVR